MKKTISKSEFIKEFDEHNRGDNFSIQGREALFNYLESLEEDTGSEIELDIIAICCEYSEYDNFEELKKDYDIEDMKELEENTSVIIINSDSFIIQCY